MYVFDGYNHNKTKKFWRCRNKYSCKSRIHTSVETSVISFYLFILKKKKLIYCINMLNFKNFTDHKNYKYPHSRLRNSVNRIEYCNYGNEKSYITLELTSSIIN
uniref:FLYWCH-type domain-containing protein n=1 Tax=Sipha flava TaxID=143950 RepID=A0A2S2Q0R1_9HEMI